ncbi:hypothetical protein [Microcoleus sp. OTE_8_concoct_300]|uniref:hypothetical protein n=1 Tax=Microcoleus sp. OTE_8_concoct_300 TaxID=2964710 RepID=UPI00403F3E29
MTTQKELPAFSVFGSKPANALLVPEIPIAVRNNCQSGCWTIGDEEYGNKCSMTIIKFSKFFGNLGMTKQTLWAQLWFIAESGNLPHGTVMLTYIKSRSLNDFNRLVVSVQSRGIEPATGIFTPSFVKHSGQKPDENGTLRSTNYYSLKWDWAERTDFSIISQASAVLTDEKTRSNLYDFEGTREMICLDNHSREEIKALTDSKSALIAAE